MFYNILSIEKIYSDFSYTNNLDYAFNNLRIISMDKKIDSTVSEPIITMPGIDIRAFPCTCKEGECEESCNPPEVCINRIARQGLVKTFWCSVCEAYTWHLKDKCLRKDHG